MNILLFGYGKMGKMIESMAVARGHQIAGRIDPLSPDAFRSDKSPDVAIEFSIPDAAVPNIKYGIDEGIPVVCGTTGWHSRKEEVEDYCLKKSGTLFYTSNFSLGVNLFFKLNENLAKVMDKQTGYDVSIDEVHHTQKKDAPSGTAITLAQAIIKNFRRKKEWVNRETGKPDDLVINSFRIDPTPGTHTVMYQSALDDIEIKHTAHSREGFAKGAILVAEWLKGKKGVLTMDDFLAEL